MTTGDYVVHIVDDEEPVRKSLAFLLTVEGFAVRLHESASAFLKAAPDIQKGCLVTDLRMPDIDGVELLRRLRRDGIRIPAIVITGHGDVPMAVAAMKAGALDFIEKPFEDQVLIDSIRRAAGELEKATASDVPLIAKRLATLTERERQVLSGIAAGLPNKTIGYDLDISPRTVEVHRANIMSKMEAKNLAELVRMAIATGVLDL
ncbi:MAG: response regulator transcription factor FixJ [Mesorhizobium sp.]|uniref:response regulator FixJ n=1 Tax=unclassified Mesorhizobium TaxID=325217 RepID=UPI000FCBE6F0|nr:MULTISPECIES: response regulator FixJ [unclassified Mesorhizobium]RUV73227.1 response regulator transcription factor FixJ [Mesorhizobium sp. M5C.F.Cr.IN.023.01.1.1]RWF86650.1 MAG: response regulator transcription factor FixJ [Mesorhizobium sp.]RWF95389.1 MAG: response regulator transcription factor FixJ [Mesorhizobium sp.]RWI39773.1 MAG: response regulator transcription factor FixJ [Mesorhizobium sp.]RWI45360.1 MAG: response regulator transcription factor FixJ [Mesorhizobium sp.]